MATTTHTPSNESPGQIIRLERDELCLKIKRLIEWYEADNECFVHSIAIDRVDNGFNPVPKVSVECVSVH